MAVLNKDKSKAKRLVDLAWTEEENRKTLRKFTEHALRRVALSVVLSFSADYDENDLLSQFMAEVKTALSENLQSNKLELARVCCLEEDAEIPETEQGKMQPDEKVKAYLESTCGFIGYTDDILRAVSAAYLHILSYLGLIWNKTQKIGAGNC